MERLYVFVLVLVHRQLQQARLAFEVASIYFTELFVLPLFYKPTTVIRLFAAANMFTRSCVFLGYQYENWMKRQIRDRPTLVGGAHTFTMT